MSFHNHDEKFIKRVNRESEAAKSLREKVEEKKDEAVINAILSTDISGLSGDEAKEVLRKVVDKAVKKFGK